MDRNKIKLTIVSNPFDLRERVDYWLNYEEGKSINNYISDKKILVKKDVVIVYSINGKLLNNEEILHVCPSPYDHIVILPKIESGRNILSLLVTVIAVVVTWWAGGSGGWLMSGSLGITSVNTANMLAGIMGAVVAAAGNMLINALFPVEPPSLPSLPGIGTAIGGGASSTTQTDTYGWGEMRNTSSPGFSIPKIYGIRRISGTILNRYIETIDNDQYYNVLIALHDGQIQGVRNIQIDGQAIENFNNVWQRIRLGNREQTTIEYFGDTFANQGFNEEITDSYYTQKMTAGDAAEGLRIEVMCPYGLYVSNSQGGLDENYVEISLEYKKVGDVDWSSIQAGGAWDTQPTGGGNQTYTTGWSYTSQGFKFLDPCDEVSFQLYDDNRQNLDGLDSHIIQYRLGIGFVDMASGWLDFATFTNNQEHQVTITGIGKQPCEVRIKQNADDYLTYVQYWFPTDTISRTVYLGGTTPGGPSGGNINIIASQNTPVRRAFEVRGLEQGQYEVRLKKISEGGTDTKYMSKIYLAGVSEIIPDDFAYPYTALLAIRALATSQLSGAVPSISCEIVREFVPVYNTNTSTWVAKRADNPAWACYDILVKPYYTMDVDYTGDTPSVYNINVEGWDGVDPMTRMIYDDFITWANWCDELTPSGNKRAVVNIVMDNQLPVWDSLLQISQVGRGMVIMRGTKFSCMIDNITDPVQLFTVGNIYKDTFKELFLSLEDRANIVEVTYFDKVRDYQRETIQVYGNDWINGGSERRHSLTLYGCTSYEQAYREAIYRLNCNKYLKRTIEFDVDIDALACQIGDVIRVQHDLPQWGYGGRVLDSTNNTVTLDQEVIFDDSSTYTIYIRHEDDTVENATITTSNITTSIITISGVWAINPERWSIFTLGIMGSEYKFFKVLSITRSQELRRTISAVEYNESMYIDGTPIEFNSSALLTISRASGIVAIERLKADTGGTWISEVHMTWDYAFRNEQKLTRWDVFRKDLSTTDSVWEFLGSTKSLYFVSNNVPWQYQHQYKIAICGFDLLANRGNSPDNPNVAITTITILWKYAPPENVDNFTATQDGLNVIFNWDHISDVDRRGYEIRQGVSWEGGVPIVKEVSANSFTTKVIYDGSYTYWIKAVDTSGNYSSNATDVTITFVGVASAVNIVYTYNEIDDFKNEIATSVSGDLSASNVTNNLIFVYSGNTVGLHVPHAISNLGSGVSLWVDSGTSLTPYTGTTNLVGYYVSPTRDIGAGAFNTLRLDSKFDTKILKVTDQTYPSRTNKTYPNDTNEDITDESILRTLYRTANTSPLTSLSWVTYTTPVLGSFRYFQRKEYFELDSIDTQLAYTTLQSYVDVPDQTWTFNDKTIGATGTTFDLKADLGVTIFVSYIVSCSILTNPYYYNVRNKSGTSFFITIFDDAGVKQAGVVDMFIKGY